MELGNTRYVQISIESPRLVAATELEKKSKPCLIATLEYLPNLLISRVSILLDQCTIILLRIFLGTILAHYLPLYCFLRRFGNLRLKVT